MPSPPPRIPPLNRSLGRRVAIVGYASNDKVLHARPTCGSGKHMSAIYEDEVGNRRPCRACCASEVPPEIAGYASNERVLHARSTCGSGKHMSAIYEDAVGNRRPCRACCASEVPPEIVGYASNERVLHARSTCGSGTHMSAIYEDEVGNQRGQEVEAAAQKNPEAAVTDWLMEAPRRNRLKSGNVFAARSEDQEQLRAIQGCLDEPTIARPLFGKIPLKLSGSVRHEVRRHVFNREAVQTPKRTSLLCNSGNTGTGKTILLQQTTVEGVRELKTMVDDHVTPKEAQGKYRPLGFYVTFNDGPTPICADRAHLEAKTFPILTAIALRMAYSVVEPPTSSDTTPFVDYKKFSRMIASQCDMNSDKDNFDRIIGALRRVLQWEGPMFIAIDEFKFPFAFRTLDECIEGLEGVCRHLLDQASTLFTNAPAVYTSYLAVSVYDAVDTVELSMSSKRRLIAQAMPIISVRDVPSYLDILGKQRGDVRPLRPHQFLFLLHMSLSTGTPRIMSECLVEHAKDKISYDGSVLKYHHPDTQTLEVMFWTCSIVSEPRRDNISEEECICAARLVAGVVTADIFDNRDPALEDYRAFALDPHLTNCCTVTDVASVLRKKANAADNQQDGGVSGTRVLVSPRFLWSVLNCWSETSSSHIRRHFDDLADTLEYHTDLATAIVRAGKALVAHGGKNEKDPSHLPVCDQLIAKWHQTTAVGLEHLTFNALCLHLSCALEDNDYQSAKELLRRVCSTVGDTINGIVKGGQLERVDIPNFPSVFFDAFAAKDAEPNDDDAENNKLKESLAAAKNALGEQYDEMERAVDYLTQKHPRTTFPPSPCNTSHMRLQSALTKGHHFCFLPSNPNKQAEDGVVFLRNKSELLVWTVLLLQSKFWLNDELGQISVVEKWRSTMAHLPATVTDTDNRVHTLRYVRILVTANPMKKHCTPPESTMELDVECGPVIGECRMYLDKITQWCPTAGLFASNIITIRDLTGDSAAGDAQDHE